MRHLPLFEFGKWAVALFQQDPLPIRVAHVPPLLDLLGFEFADGRMQYVDPHLALLQRVSIELEHSVDHDQIKSIQLVILHGG